MKFDQAYIEMLKGHKVARPCFKGYWYIDGFSGYLTIHTRDDQEITEGDFDLTIKNVLAEDWYIIGELEVNK